MQATNCVEQRRGSGGNCQGVTQIVSRRGGGRMRTADSGSCVGGCKLEKPCLHVAASVGQTE
jgi:hypothetical protein